MADQDNGGYVNYGDGESDFKRKADNKKELRVTDDEEDHHHEGGKGSGKPNEYYIKELLSERVQMDGKYPHADRMLQQEINNARQNGKLAGRDTRYVDIYHEKPIKVTVKVTVPIKEHPKFNFVGKLLGPKGNSLRRLQEDTMCKMAIMGRGSMKDRAREESFRQSLDPKYGHLNDELHVEISSLAPPAEAHARIAYALAEVSKYLIPDSNDEIRQEQFRELVADGVLPAAGEEEEYYHGSGSSRPPPPPPPASSSSGGYSKRPYLANRSRSPGRGPVPVKQKVMSILDRTRSGMDERYGSSHDDYDLPPYDRGYHHEMDHPPHSRSRNRPAEPPIEYRRDYYTRDASPPTYVKSPPVSDHHHHQHRSSTSSSSSSWRYASSRGQAPPPPADSHRGYHHPPAAPERSSYRTSPYMRPQHK